MPVMSDPAVFDVMINLLSDRLRAIKCDRVLGIESRGFLIGPMLAQKLKLPFSPIRKKGKLPGELFSVKYDLEYGSDILEVQKNGLPKGSNCVIVDDLIATGGSLEASKKLVEMSGSSVSCCAVIIELSNLEGRKKLGETPTISLYQY